MPSSVSMKALLETGVHFGHRTQKWNPKMKPYIFAERNGIHIIDLQQTIQNLNQYHDMVSQMVADDRYCIDILHQIHAIKAALAKVETEILKTHAACCVEEAIAAGDADAQRRKFSELVEVFAKAKL